MNLNGEAAPNSNTIPRSIETNLDVKVELNPTVLMSSVAAPPFIHETGEGAAMTDTTMSNSEAPQPTTKQPRAPRPYKRRKKSPVPSYRNFMVRTADQIIQPEINIEDMPFDKSDLDDIQTAVQAAQTRRQVKFHAQIQNHAVALEKLKKQYEAALGRANRRALEANEKNRALIHDYAALKKSIKFDIAESVASARAEMKEQHTKALSTQNVVNPDLSMTIQVAERPSTITVDDAPANDVVTAVASGSLNAIVNEAVEVVVNGPINNNTNIPADTLVNGLGDGSTVLANNATDASVNELVDGSTTRTSEIANLRAQLDTAAHALEHERSSRQQDNRSQSEMIARLANEVHTLKNAQLAPQVESVPKEEMVRELEEFNNFKEATMKLAREFPHIFSLDVNADWSSTKVGLALNDLVHSRLKQEAQVKVHELLEQRAA